MLFKCYANWECGVQTPGVLDTRSVVPVGAAPR